MANGYTQAIGIQAGFALKSDIPSAFELFVSTTLLSSTDIQNLKTIPIPLAPAPKSNQILFPVACLLNYKFDTAGYMGVGVNDLAIVLGSSFFTFVGSSAGLLDQNVDTVDSPLPATTQALADQQAPTSTVAGAVPSIFANGIYSVGAGTLQVTLFYVLVTIP